MTVSVFGNDTQTAQRVEIPQSSRRQGLYIISGTGQGKTGLIENLIVQDIEQGLGVGLLDPHGDLTNSVIARIPDKRLADVILLDIADEDHPFGLNLFACDNPTSAKAVQRTVDQVMHIFEKLFEIGRVATPLLMQYLRNCTHTLVANPGYTMADLPLLLTERECRRQLVANVTDPQVRLFWQEYESMKPAEQREERSSIQRRLDEFLQPLTRNIVGQAATTIDFRRIMDERKIVLVTLDPTLESVTSLIGSVVIALLLNAAYSRADIEVKKRKQFNLYADEFQRFATDDFATLLSEARKFGLATTIAHQTRQQLSERNRATSLQAANLVVFRISGQDAEELAKEFDATPPPPAMIGQRPLLTPVQDVVDHLLKRGHKNSLVSQFVTNYLTSFAATFKGTTPLHLSSIGFLERFPMNPPEKPLEQMCIAFSPSACEAGPAKNLYLRAPLHPVTLDFWHFTHGDAEEGTRQPTFRSLARSFLRILGIASGAASICTKCVFCSIYVAYLTNHTNREASGLRSSVPFLRYCLLFTQRKNK